MLALQDDVTSGPDRILAQRLAYAIDHATGPLKNDPALHQAADILRKWNGSVDANAAAPAIVNAARAALWPMLLIPKLAPEAGTQLAQGADLSKVKNLRADAAQAANLWQLYTWGERESVEEQLITHTPARWLPSGFATWDDFLAAVVQRGLRNAHAPLNLATWQQGSAFPLDIEHPLFSHATLLARLLLGVPTGTGPQSQSGDSTTVRQSGHAFGPSERFTADSAIPIAPPSASSSASPATPPARSTWTSSSPGCAAPPTPSHSRPPPPSPPSPTPSSSPRADPQPRIT